jgi:hypothetical protein
LSFFSVAANSAFSSLSIFSISVLFAFTSATSAAASWLFTAFSCALSIFSRTASSAFSNRSSGRGFSGFCLAALCAMLSALCLFSAAHATAAYSGRYVQQKKNRVMAEKILKVLKNVRILKSPIA